MPSTPRAPRGEYAKSAERRRQIVAAAVRVFSVSGYREGSLRDIAELADVTSAGLRHHYPTKLDLLRAVLEWRDEDALGRVRAQGLTGMAVVWAWAEEIRRNATRPELVALHVTLSAEGTSPDHPMHAYFVDRYQRLHALLVEALTVAQGREEIRAGVDIESAARLLIAATDGMQVQWLLSPDAVDMADVLQRQVGALLLPTG